MATAGYLVFTHWPQKFSLRLPMLWWMKAMLESEKKLFCHFIGEIRTVPFENPLTREYQ